MTEHKPEDRRCQLTKQHRIKNKDLRLKFIHTCLLLFTRLCVVETSIDSRPSSSAVMDVADVTDATPGNAEAGPSRPQIAAQPSIDLTGESDDDDEKSHHPTSGSGATHSSPTTSMNHGPKPHQNGYSNSNTNGHYNGNGHASTSHHYSPLYNFPAHPTQPVPNSCYGNPYTFGTPAYSPPPYNGMMGNGYPGYVSSPYASSSSHMIHPPPTPGGGTSQSAIDLTSAPSPPQRNPKQPVCIGAITTQAYMLYPSPVVVLGGVSDKEKLDLIPYRGAEFLKVKLKVGRLTGMTG